MWRALGAELAYLKVHLVTAVVIAVAVAVMVDGAILLDENDATPAWLLAALPSLFLIIAGMVVGFIGMGLRLEERRSRLLMAGPLAPRQLAGVLVLLPTVLIATGVLAGGLMVGAAALATGSLDWAGVSWVLAHAAMMLGVAQLAPLAQESTAAHRQGRRGHAVAGWAGFSLAIPLLATFQWLVTAIPGLGQAVIAALLMAGSATLCARRTDFTR